MIVGSTKIINSHLIHESSQERSEQRAPRARCVAAALIRDDKVLLVKRLPHRRVYPDLWDLPGGHIEGDESAEEALRRETYEELSIDVAEYRKLGTILDPVEPADITVFAITARHGDPTNAAPDEHSEIGWFKADALPESAALDCYRELVVEAMTAQPPDS